MGLAFRGLPFRQDARGAIQEALACVGQSEPARRAVEQSGTEPLFQPGDGLGDRGLGQLEILGGERKGPEFGDLGEDSEPFEIRQLWHDLETMSF
jgi:hypothetical protein